MNKSSYFFVLIILSSLVVNGRQQESKLPGSILEKSFIWQRGEKNPLNEPLSIGFRKKIEISKMPEKAEMMIFADSRYLLWINGKYVERGPCRFDPKGPQYDLLDVKSYFAAGQNTIAIMVQGNVT